MNIYKEVLLMFGKGDKWSRSSLFRRFGESLTNDTIEKGYIVEISKTDLNDPQYIITEAGRTCRDS